MPENDVFLENPEHCVEGTREVDDSENCSY